jgi:hypothetical protein
VVKGYGLQNRYALVRIQLARHFFAVPQHDLGHQTVNLVCCMSLSLLKLNFLYANSSIGGRPIITEQWL